MLVKHNEISSEPFIGFEVYLHLCKFIMMNSFMQNHYDNDAVYMKERGTGNSFAFFMVIMGAVSFIFFNE